VSSNDIMFVTSFVKISQLFLKSVLFPLGKKRSLTITHTPLQLIENKVGSCYRVIIVSYNYWLPPPLSLLH